MKTNFCGKRKLDDDNDSAQVPVFVQYSREVDEMGDKEVYINYVMVLI